MPLASSSTALVHVKGLGASPSPGDDRIRLRTALRPYVRSWVAERGTTDHFLEYTLKELNRKSFLPPVTAALQPDPWAKSIHLRFHAYSASWNCDRLQFLVDHFYRGPIDGPIALRYMHAFVRRMLGHTTSVDDAKRRAKACILHLHPDKCHALMDIQVETQRLGVRTGQANGTELNRKTLLHQYISILHALEEPSVAPYIVGHVAWTWREALAIIWLVIRQRVSGRQVAAAIAVTGVVLGAALLLGAGPAMAA